MLASRKLGIHLVDAASEALVGTDFLFEIVLN
jgi:hypothetical protein